MSNIDILIQAPIFNIQLILDGLLIGALFALAAYGMALVWGVMNIINIVQGEFVILGGFVCWTLAEAGGPPLLGIPLAMIALFVLGYVLYKLVIFRLVDRDLFNSLLATFGMSILLQQLMNEVFGADVRIVDTNLESWFFVDRMVAVPQIKLLALVLTIIIAAALVIFMRYSRLGQAIRATAQNARAARILGIDTDRVYAITYGINAAVCGAAGALVVMSLTIHPFQGLAYTVRSFTVVVVAGLGNISGVVVAALGLGMAEQYAGFILGAEYQLAFVYLLLVVILMYRSFMLGRQRKFLK